VKEHRICTKILGACSVWRVKEQTKVYKDYTVGERALFKVKDQKKMFEHFRSLSHVYDKEEKRCTTILGA
jgi:hypothetical protein